MIDEDFDFVEGAIVTGCWTLNRRALNTASNQTDPEGTATLESRKAWARSGSAFTFAVTGVSKEGYTYPKKRPSRGPFFRVLIEAFSTILPTLPLHRVFHPVL